MNHAPGSAREALAASIGSDPWEGIEILREAGETKARAEGVAYQMQEMRKVVLARIMNELATVHAKERMAEAKLERMARADQRYIEHVRKTAEAIEAKEAATAHYFGIKSELEWDAHAAFHSNALAKLER